MATRDWRSRCWCSARSASAELERAVVEGVHVPLPFRIVAGFTAGGVLLAVFTVVLVGAQL